MGQKNPDDGTWNLQPIHDRRCKVFSALVKRNGQMSGMPHANGWLFSFLQSQHSVKMKCNSASIFTQPGPEP